MNSLRQKTLLVALGNPLSGDDGFGPRVLESLQSGALQMPPGVSLINAGTDLLNYIESFPEYDRVVLVDAILDPDGKMGPPGRIALLDEEDLSSWQEGARSAHQVSPLIAVKLFRTLHPGIETKIQLVGLLVDQISFSPVYLTDDRITEAVSLILALL